ncbi:GspH/FimT family pseudopilin [Vibrio sp.]|nr:GspH/FimT family pseudopilin [Vibrio sp.]
MNRGFTLIELLITIVVLSALLAFALPNYSSLTAQNKIKQLTESLQTFMVTAKSEAVFRNQDLYIHIVSMASGTTETSGEWSLELSDSNTLGSPPIMTFSGARFGHLAVSHNYTSDQITINGTRGKISKSGFLGMYDIADSSKVVKVAANSGRVRACSDGGDYYGYKTC